MDNNKFIKQFIRLAFFLIIIILSVLAIIGNLVVFITQPEMRIPMAIAFGGAFLLYILNWAFTND